MYQKIIELYLKCTPQVEIAEILGLNEAKITRILQNIKNNKMKFLTETPPDSLQVYDVWNFSKLDQQYGQDYAGRIPGQINEKSCILAEKQQQGRSSGKFAG